MRNGGVLFNSSFVFSYPSIRHCSAGISRWSPSHWSSFFFLMVWMFFFFLLMVCMFWASSAPSIVMPFTLLKSIWNFWLTLFITHKKFTLDSSNPIAISLNCAGKISTWDPKAIYRTEFPWLNFLSRHWTQLGLLLWGSFLAFGGSTRQRGPTEQGLGWHSRFQ